MRLAGHYERLGTERAFEVLARAKALEAQGRTIIHLEIGEPDFDTPPHVVEAGARALREGHTHYCPAPGLPELREAAARSRARVSRISISPVATRQTSATCSKGCLEARPADAAAVRSAAFGSATGRRRRAPTSPTG